ncbi:MAG: S24 family peptidase [Pseudomonadota bacterium]
MGVFLLKVRGASMAPRLRPGAWAVFRTTKCARPGDVVAARHRSFGTIVKEVVSATGAGVQLRGTGLGSTSQERLGTVAHEHVLGKLVLPLPFTGR